MALKPLFQWEIDENGLAKRDASGRKIPHKKAGQVKKLNEMTERERADFEDSLRKYRIRQQVTSQQVLGRLAKALETLQAARAK